MRDFMELGCTPCDEKCAQVGEADYTARTRAECRRYIDLLTKRFSEPPGTANFAVKGFDHDFGRYYEVVIFFDDDAPAQVSYAYHCEANCPATWDDVSKVPWVFDEERHQQDEAEHNPIILV